MICYHWMWDVVYIFGGDFPWFHSPLGYVWQQSICWSFILFSGFSLGLSGHTVRRGLIVSGFGIAISVVTGVFMPGQAIVFGVLTFLGVAMLLGALLRPVLSKLPPILGLILCGILFFLLRDINSGFLGFEGLRFDEIPGVMYNGYITAFFGFPHEAFFSADYFSLMPWIFLYFVGFFIYRIYEENIRPAGKGRRVPAIGFIGRHALIIYVIHQPVIYGILYLINLL